MQKKIFLATLILMFVVIISTSFVGCNKIEISADLAVGSRPDSLASLMSAEDKAFVDSAMTSTDENVKKQAVMTLFNMANRSRIDTHTSLVLQESDAGNPMGDIIMHAFKLKVGDKWYYQLATQVETGNAFLNELMSAFAGFLKVGYSTGKDQNYYFNAFGPQFECNCEVTTFPYASYVIPEGTDIFNTVMSDEEIVEALYCVESLFEINNMRFVAEIIADGAEITYNEDEGFYTVKFSVDMNADPDLIAAWMALPVKDMAVGGQTLEYYEYYNATLEIWDNGYAKSYSSNSSREAGMGSGKPADKFEYIWNEQEILKLLKEDTRITEDYQDIVVSIEDYVDYYSNPSFVARKLTSLEIAGIVIGCLVAVVIAIVVTIEVLVKKGKLPKLAAQRERAKQKKLAKKASKKGNEEPEEENEPQEEVVDDDLKEVAADKQEE